jgi:hypothetical protein
MASLGGKKLVDKVMVVHGLGPVAPSSSTPDIVSLKDVRSAEVVITVLNGSGVTGSAITLKQSSAVAATGEKALAFSTYYANTDPANGAALTETTASSNTFTTTNTNSATAIYRIPVDPSTLDLANSFDCVRAGTANATNTTVTVHYVLEPKYGGNYATMPNVVVD